MNRFARPDNFSTRIRNPLLREHFVYRAYDEIGDLLYVGCTMDFPNRLAGHRANGDWAHLAARFRLSGPHNYETARQIERDAIRSERPQFNSMTPERTAVAAAHQRILKRRQAALMADGMDFWDSFHAASAHAQRVLRCPGGRERFRSDDLTIAYAKKADLVDAARYERATA